MVTALLRMGIGNDIKLCLHMSLLPQCVEGAKTE